MKRFRSLAIVAVLLVIPVAGFARAESFTLSNVKLTLGVGGSADGTISGSFTTGANNTLTSLDIVASKAGNFPGFEYTLANSTVTNDLPSFFQLDSGKNELRLIFDGGLTSSGATLSTSSYESEKAGGSREVASGSVVVTPAAVPEPSSLVLATSALAIALGGIWAKGRRVALVGAVATAH